MKYQAAFLLIAFTVVATAYALSNSFLGLGDINAPFEIGVLNLEVNPLVSWTVDLPPIKRTRCTFHAAILSKLAGFV